MDALAAVDRSAGMPPIRRACAGRNNSNPQRIKSARRLAGRIGFGVNGEGEGRFAVNVS
jgi:hypothetical protein